MQRAQAKHNLSSFTLWALSTWLLPLCLVFSGCHSVPQGKTPPPVPVEVLTLKPQTIPQETEYLAKIDSRQSVFLTPQVEGQLIKVWVRPGQTVKRNQPLFLIDPEVPQAQLASRIAAAAAYQAQIQEAEEALAKALAQQSISQAQVDFQSTQHARYQALYEVESASQQQVQQISTALSQAEAEQSASQHQISEKRHALEASRKKYAQSQAEIREQQALLKHYTVRAPFDGILDNIPVKVGDIVTHQTQLSGITVNQNLEIVANIPAEHASRLQVGGKLNLMDNQDQPLGQARIYFVSPNVNLASQTLTVRARLDEALSSQVLSDQLVRVRIIWGEAPGLAIPTAAVFNLGGQDFIYLAKKSEPKDAKPENVQSEDDKPQALRPNVLQAQQVPVTLGDIVGNYYTVLKGVQAGDVLITSGIQKLKNGAAIQVVPPSKPHD